MTNEADMVATSSDTLAFIGLCLAKLVQPNCRVEYVQYIC